MIFYNSAGDNSIRKSFFCVQRLHPTFKLVVVLWGWVGDGVDGVFVVGVVG